MAKDKRKAQQKSQEELLLKAAEATVALNPLVGVSAEDIKKTLKGTAKKAVAQPGKLARYTSGYATKVAKILKGTDDYDKRDKRFDDPAWENNMGYKKLKQAYFAWEESMGELVKDLELDGLDERRAKFVSDIVTSTMSPTNFLLGNPKALRKVLDTGGSSLIKGLKQFVDDVQHNQGMPQQVDKTKFVVGENLATSEGAVVFRNELLELIQYKPKTAKVHKRPLLILPPQINKFYMYDLTPEKSFFQFCINEGFQLFAVSWRNPTAENRDWGLDAYVNASAEAIEAVRAITKSDDLNLLGACSGGITASILSSYLKQSERDYVNSLTLSVCMLSMRSEELELGVFTSPAGLVSAREKSAEKGILEGSELAKVFTWMRPNDLIWNYHVNNYLMGEAPPAFDILYWNSDSTNLPAQLHSDFLDMFETNPLPEPGELSVMDTAIDLQALDCDKYVTAGLTDHITPWKVCYQTTQFCGGDIRFVLSSSGHIQSLINPPTNPKAKYFYNEDLPATADSWLEAAEQRQGSWWTDWSEWLAERSGGQKVAPKTLGNRKYKSKEAAPGTYVYG